MMNKPVFILGAVAVSAIAFLYWLADQRGQTIIELKSELATVKKEVKECRNVIEKTNKAEEKADSQISEIKTIVKTVPSDCACYDSPIDSSILNRVRGK